MFESKRRALLLLLLSLAFGAAAVILFSSYMQETKDSLGELVTVQVAGSDIPAGRVIDETLLEEQELPRKYMLDSLIESPADLIGRVSMVPIVKGAVITQAMLRDNSLVSGDFRQVLLRAPLAVFDDQIDAYDQVDLLISYEQDGEGGQAAGADRRTTQVLLKGVTVSSVHKTGDEITAVGVMVKLADAKSVVWALNYGKEVRLLKTGNAKAAQEKGSLPDAAAPSASPSASPVPSASPAAGAASGSASSSGAAGTAPNSGTAGAAPGSGSAAKTQAAPDSAAKPSPSVKPSPSASPAKGGQ
ncbi:SAF domain-containing protein [Paenibacillus sp. FSL W8-1187]|uniref:SAF domain-containing protein n=1 Tax=Paenibacillus sp. FSL W8-1187 TaxID=2975339 RepID=UPI0030DCC812